MAVIPRGGCNDLQNAWDNVVTTWYFICAVVAVMLLVYLFVALLKPEWF